MQEQDNAYLSLSSVDFIYKLIEVIEKSWWWSNSWTEA